MSTAPSFLVWFIAYVWFTPEYLESRGEEFTQEDSLTSDHVTGTTKQRPSLLSQLWHSRLCHFKAIAVERIESPQIVGGRHLQAPTSTLTYFRDAFHHIYTNSVCSVALIHSLFVCLFWKLMNSAVPLTLAANNLDSIQEATLESLCGGMFTNLFYQYAWNNAFYIAGATLYAY